MASPTPGNWPGQQEAACPRPQRAKAAQNRTGSLVPPALGSTRDPSSPHSCPPPPQGRVRLSLGKAGHTSKGRTSRPSSWTAAGPLVLQSCLRDGVGSLAPQNRAAWSSGKRPVGRKPAGHGRVGIPQRGLSWGEACGLWGLNLLSDSRQGPPFPGLGVR